MVTDMEEERLTLQYAEDDGQMTPAHAGGAMGELDAAFVLGQRGFGIVIGPGGPGGHRLTASGFDIIAYNPATDRVWIVDNKASGGTSTVQGASAITTNLEPNLVTAIQQVRAARSFPHQQTIVRHLESALAALRTGRPFPPTVERYVTNAGGYHSGISRSLQQQGVRFLDITGAGTRATRRQDVSTARQQGVSPGRPTTHQPTGAPGSPPAPPVTMTPSPRGTAVVGGLQVGLAGLNFALNWLNDREQQRRLQETLTRMDPAIQAERQRRPEYGILLFIYYHQVQAPPDSAIRPGAVFSHVSWETGRSQDEALQAFRSRSTMRAAPPRGSIERVTLLWIQPLRPSSIINLQTPFPRAGFGVFGPNGAMLQDVRWGGKRGFDDTGQTGVSPQVLAAAMARTGGRYGTARFLILDPPASIHWIWGRQVMTDSIDIVHRQSAVTNVHLKAVDLDPISPFGNVAAVPVFPYDDFTDLLFRSTPATHDNLNQLRLYPNIAKMRWVRPENIRPVQSF